MIWGGEIAEIAQLVKVLGLCDMGLGEIAQLVTALGLYDLGWGDSSVG